jgi:hypothetical protein
MHGLMGGGWKRGATTVDAKDPGGETLGVSAKTYRRATPPRQSSTLHGAFYRTALYPVLHRINTYLLRWIMNKYKKLSTWKKAIQSMSNAAASQPRYFAHWAWAKPANR